MNNRERVYCGIFSLLFSSCNVYIYSLDNIIDKYDFYIVALNILILFVIVYFFIKSILCKLDRYINNVSDVHEEKEISDLNYYFFVAVSLFLMWFIIFLAYYPGLFTYDVHNQLPQVINGYSTWQPLIHTLYLSFFYYIIGGKVFDGNYNYGIAVATLAQMLLFSCMMSYIHLYLYRVRTNRIVRIILIVLTGILPTFSMLAIALTKDVFFAGFLGVLFTLLCYYLDAPKGFLECKKMRRIYIFSVVGTILLRNNGIFPVLAITVFYLIQIIRKKANKKIFIYTVIGVIIGIGISTSLKIGLHAKTGPIDEMLNIPYQQLACAYSEHKNDINQDEIDGIMKVIPNVSNYNAHLSDPLKWAVGVHKIEFINLYCTIGMKYPVSYIKGLLQLDAGYLCIKDNSFAEIYGTDNRQGVLMTETKEGFNITHKSYFPCLENLYEELYSNNRYEKIFILNVLLSPALYFWIIVFCFLLSLIYKKHKTIPLFVFLFTLLATIMAGPCCLLRYALPYIVCIPQLVICVLPKRYSAREAD